MKKSQSESGANRRVNRPGFRAYLPSWEGCRDAEQVRQGDQGEGGWPGQGSRGDYESEWAAIKAVSARLGTSAETLRKWLRRAEVDAGQAPGPSTESAREIRELKGKCAELERTIAVLKAARSFFAGECDPLSR
jgi:transposase